jgi:hypothetical protein
MKARLHRKYRPLLSLLAKREGLPVRTFAGLILKAYLSKPFPLDLVPPFDMEP